MLPSYDFVAVDFETANDYLSSACSMGLAAVKNLAVVDTEYFLIKPTDLLFAKENIEIHGLTSHIVRDAPQFPAVWAQVQEYFKSNLIVAHNAHFDMSVLKRCLIEHELEIPQFEYLCSIQISNCICKGLGVSASLLERAHYFNLSTNGHHNALSDAKMCASLVAQSIKSAGEKTLRSFCKAYPRLPVKNFATLRPQMLFKQPRHRFEKIVLSEMAATVESFDQLHPFYGKNIVFTGELSSMDRRTAMQKTLNCGGTVKSTVSKKTDIVILGIQDKALVGPGGASRKERRAYELIEQGFDLKIVRETKFLKLLNRKKGRR